MGIFKQRFVHGVIVSFLLLSTPVDGFTAARPKTPMRSGFGLITGYKTIDLGHVIEYDHQSSSRIPTGYSLGTYGITNLGPSIEMAFLGVGYQRPVSKRLLLTAGLGFLRDFGSNRYSSSLKPVGLGAIAISDVNVGGFSSLGVSYYYKRFFAGAEFEYDVIKIRHGIDWYNRDETEVDELQWYFSGGPKIGYYVFNNLSVEGSALVGQNTSYNAVIRWMFFK